MPCVTTCTECSDNYEAGSEEQSNEQVRLCPSCRRTANMGNLHQIIRMLDEGEFTADGIAAARLALLRAESRCETAVRAKDAEELLPNWGCYDCPGAPAAVAALNQAGCELVSRIWEERGVAEALRRVRAIQQEHANAGADDTEGREALWELVRKACTGTVYNPDGLWARYYSS